MPIRMTGINSGMDTESIIADLVKVKSAKRDKLIKAQTKVQWKQDAWKELNAKVYSFYTKSLSNMRLKGDYMKKTTTVSNPDIASIVTGGTAVDGVQEMTVNKLAKSAYVTGGEITTTNGSVTGKTLVKDLLTNGVTPGSFTIKKNTGDPVTINITETTTIDDVVTQLKEAGLNANFDAKNGRFFISAQKSGHAAGFVFEDTSNSGVLNALGLGSTATIIAGQDAEITLNRATFKSSTNTFEINGLTITAKQESPLANGTRQSVTVTTAQDTDGIYDMIKGFLKEYNTLINEMDALYNADSAKGYEPLTDEEKEALSDKEVEKWEEKIKKSLLRNDSTLSDVASAMKTIMVQGVTLGDGSKAYLSDFGINTLGYFNAEDNEKNAYHIDGDPDNVNTANNEDKLKAAIASDPDKVIEFFSSLTSNLYQKVGDMMKKTDFSSSFTVYDDVLMKKEYDDYTKEIAEENEKITAFEDRYYAKFAAMETALAKLQSKESAIAGLFNM